MSWSVAVLIALMGGVGSYLLMNRSFTRIILGLGLLANAVNLVALAAAGLPAEPPLVGRPEPLGDPVPQALVLTAIVIGFGVTAFMLAAALRSWTIDGSDDVEDDLEDRRLARAALDAEADTGPDPTRTDSEFGDERSVAPDAEPLGATPAEPGTPEGDR